MYPQIGVAEPRKQDDVKRVTRADHCRARRATSAAPVEPTATPATANTCSGPCGGRQIPAHPIGMAPADTSRVEAVDRNGPEVHVKLSALGGHAFQSNVASRDAGLKNGWSHRREIAQNRLGRTFVST